MGPAADHEMDALGFAALIVVEKELGLPFEDRLTVNSRLKAKPAAPPEPAGTGPPLAIPA